jgi:hypothetical protein
VPEYKKQHIKKLHEVFESEITYVNAMEYKEEEEERKDVLIWSWENMGQRKMRAGGPQIVQVDLEEEDDCQKYNVNVIEHKSNSSKSCMEWGYLQPGQSL